MLRKVTGKAAKKVILCGEGGTLRTEKRYLAAACACPTYTPRKEEQSKKKTRLNRT